ncbi:MAG: deoxyribose-phosphate aldolase, partial [Rhizomicrobium sp.]
MSEIPTVSSFPGLVGGGNTVRNAIVDYDAELIAGVRISRAALEHSVATLATRRPLAGPWRAAWLIKALTCIDLTTLAGDDTPGRVRRLCAKARQPVRADILEKLGVPPVTTGAVCVYHAMIETAVEALDGSAIPVAAVSTGFPEGLSPLSTRIAEVEASVAAGAKEIDIVISRGLVLTGNTRAVYDEVKLFRQACGDAHLKAILGAGNLASLDQLARASYAAMMAGADFIKTSTGKEPVNATPLYALVMARAIADWKRRTGAIVGFKPAGGISTPADALTYQRIMAEELGRDW